MVSSCLVIETSIHRHVQRLTIENSGSDNKKCATYIFPTAPPVVFKSIFPDSSSVAADAPYTGLFCGPDAVTETVYPSPTN